MKIEIKTFFHFFWREKNRKQGWIACFFTLKDHCAYSNNGKNVKITGTVTIAVTKHPSKFEIKNCRKEKLWQLLYHLVPDSISAFRLRPKTHMRSAVLCRSLNNSVWFRLDWNVQHYFVSLRKTFIDIFVALSDLRKKNYYTHSTTKKHAIFFAWKSHTKFCLHKKTTQNFTCTWPEHSTIASS